MIPLLDDDLLKRLRNRRAEHYGVPANDYAKAPPAQDALARAILSDRAAAARRRVGQDQAVTAYHGTRTAALQSIIDNGLLAHPFKHYHPRQFYRGERGASVYVTENPEIAKRWALSEVDDPADVTILQLELPRERLLPDEEAPEAERFVGDIPPDWIKSAYPLQRDGTFGAAIPLHHDANDDGPPGVIRYTVLHHDSQLRGTVQDAYDADALGVLLGEDADPEWDESKVKRSKGGQFAKSAASKESDAEPSGPDTHVSHPHVSAWVKKFGFSGKKHATSFAGPDGSEIKIHPPKKEGQKWTTVWSHHDKDGNQTASGPTIGSLTAFLHAHYTPTVKIGGGQTGGGTGKAKTETTAERKEPERKEPERKEPPEQTKADTHHEPPFKDKGVDIAPPKQFEITHDGDGVKSYKLANGNTLHIFDDGKWTYFDLGTRKITDGETQAELDAVTGVEKTSEKQKETEQTETEQTETEQTETEQTETDTHHAPPFKHNIAAPKTFTEIYKDEDVVGYEDGGNTLYIYSGGRWSLWGDGGARITDGETQTDLDDAIAKLGEPKETDTHHAPPFKGLDLAPPKQFTLNSDGTNVKSYADAAGNTLWINQRGFWQLYDSRGKEVATGGDQAKMDAEIAKLGEKKPERKPRTASKYGKKPFDAVDLAPLKGFKLDFDGPTLKSYKDKNGRILQINGGDGRWLFSPDGGKTVLQGETQAGLDDAVAKSETKTETTATHHEPPFKDKGVDLAPPKDYKIEYDGDAFKVYKHDDNVLRIYDDGNWSLDNDTKKIYQNGQTQAELDAAIAKTTESTARTSNPTGKLQNVHISANTSAEFSESMRTALDALPRTVIDKLHAADTKISVSNMLVDVLPHLARVRPRGWPPGSTWQNSEGLYSPREKHVVVAEQYKSRINNNMVTTTRGPATMRHEIGHAYDHALGRFSETDTFERAYMADRRDGKLKSTTHPHISYFLQKGPAGRSEAFAEIFAGLTGGGTPSTRILDHFPKTAELMRSLLT